MDLSTYLTAFYLRVVSEYIARIISYYLLLYIFSADASYYNISRLTRSYLVISLMSPPLLVIKFKNIIWYLYFYFILLAGLLRFSYVSQARIVK
jgi:hypothetical protein